MEFRIKEIQEAAAEVFRRESFEKVTMQMIASEAGFTRSNLYRYFKTREEIFLAIFTGDAETWLDDLTKEFTGPMPLEDFVQLWTEVLCRQKRFLELSPLLAPTLEKNSSEEIYLQTKVKMNELISRALPILSQILPDFTEQQLMDFFLVHQSLAAGLRPMTHYSDWQMKILKEQGLEHFKLDFPAFYEQTILGYLRGISS